MKTSSAVVLALALAAGAPAAGWRQAAPGWAWDFPRDHHAHPGFRTEWWYLTGHLRARGAPARAFGYQFTLFRVGLTPAKPSVDSAWAARALVMGHAALSDLGAKRHRFAEVLYRATPQLGGFPPPPDPVLAWSRAPAGTDDRWEIRWEGDAFAFRARDDAGGLALELTARPVKPMVFQGPGGYSKKSSDTDAASLYYSFTRMATRGRVRAGGEWVEVEGESWFDKEFSTNELAPDQAGWDWFSLQLADGRELMLYVLRAKAGGVSHAQGTLVATDGSVRYLGPEAWELAATGTWASPEHGAVYPSGWTLRLPGEGLDLVVAPAFPAQENRSRLVPGMAYWEGAVDLTTSAGAPAGQGYVELTGYGSTRRPTR